MKNMLNFKNFSAEELQKILDLALDMKKKTFWKNYTENIREKQ